MRAGFDSRYGPALAAIFAAFLWATYYFFVLALAPNTAPSAVFVYPLLIGGVAYFGWVALSGRTHEFLAIWKQGSAWVRTGLLCGMQLSTLAATYLAGPVTTSLFALLGDVVVAPILVMVILAQGREQLRSASFPVGVALAAGGAALTIVGGSTIQGLSGWAWVVVPAVPLTVAFFFVFAADGNRTGSPAAVVGQSMLAAGLVGLVLTPAIPGGISGLAVVSPGAWGLLIGMGLTSFFFASVLYFWSIGRVGLFLPTVLMATIPIFTLALSVVLLDEPPALEALVGVPLAALGGYLVFRGEHHPWGARPVGASPSPEAGQVPP